MTTQNPSGQANEQTATRRFSPEISDAGRVPFSNMIKSLGTANTDGYLYWRDKLYELNSGDAQEYVSRLIEMTRVHSLLWYYYFFQPLLEKGGLKGRLYGDLCTAYKAIAIFFEYDIHPPVTKAFLPVPPRFMMINDDFLHEVRNDLKRYFDIPMERYRAHGGFRETWESFLEFLPLIPSTALSYCYDCTFANEEHAGQEPYDFHLLAFWLLACSTLVDSTPRCHSCYRAVPLEALFCPYCSVQLAPDFPTAD